MPKISKHSWKCLLPAMLYCLDIGLTLIGQHSSYWQGDFSTVEEANPIARILLLQHPALFISLAILWLLVFSSFLLFSNGRIAIAIGFLLTFGHSIGSATWLFRHGFEGKIAAILLMITAKLLHDWIWQRVGIHLTTD